jgi:hypothetical protein
MSALADDPKLVRRYGEEWLKLIGPHPEKQTTVLAIDPGCDESAFILLHGTSVFQHLKVKNAEVEGYLLSSITPSTEVVIEMIASYGMPVGREVFETCVWIGRFMSAAQPSKVTRIYRRDVKLHLCGSLRAKDANVRQALIDLWGGKEKAIGCKKSPGPLYGIKADEWAALAVAVTYRG